jgi:predicted DNA-binding protein (MmcQ/YjbR family)
MDIETLRDYCLEKKGVEESFPFGEDTLVFKVSGKIFLLTGLNDTQSFNVKCDPELAISLREQHPEVLPGYHMNKKHWNTVKLKGSLTEQQLKDMIDHSYELVVSGLPQKDRTLLK